MSVAPKGRDLDSQTKAAVAARAALDKQAEGVLMIDLRALSNVTDFFVVCTAGSERQISAIKEHIEAALASRGATVWHAEGITPPAPGGSPRDPQWMLMDCGDVVIHVLDQRGREFYRIEDLWGDAPRVPLPPA